MKQARNYGIAQYGVQRRYLTLESLILLLWCVIFGLVSMGCSGDEGVISVPTEIAITSPAEGAILAETRFQVRGTASGVDYVKVNGQRTEVIGDEWSALVLMPEGLGEIVAAVDTQEALPSERIEVIVDATPPTLVLETPERALRLEESEPATLRVEGFASDAASGIEVVRLNNRTLTLNDEGRFASELTVDPGYSVLEVEVVDRAGHRSDALRGILRGPWVAPTNTVTSAFSFLLTPELLNTAAAVGAEILTPELAQIALVQQLPDGENLTLDSVSFAPVDISVLPRPSEIPEQPGVLDLAIGVRDFEVQGTFMLGETTFSWELAVQAFTVDVEVLPRLDATSQLVVEIGEASLNVNNEDLKITVRDAQGREVSTEDFQTIRDVLVGILRLSLPAFVGNQLFEELYDPNILKRRIELFGRVLGFEVGIEEVSVAANGLRLRLALSFDDVQFADIPDDVMALDQSPSRREATQAEGDLLVQSTQAALNRIMDAVWRSGLLHQGLSGDDFAGFELPVELTSGALALALDGRISNLVEAQTAAAILLRPLFPPYIVFQKDRRSGSEGTGDPKQVLLLRLGELSIDVVLDADAAEPKKLLTLAVFLDLGVRVLVEGSALRFEFDVNARTDLVDEPLFDLDDTKTEELIGGIVRLVPAMIADGLVIAGETNLPWLELDEPRIDVHGQGDDYVTFGLKLSAVANESGL